MPIEPKTIFFCVMNKYFVKFVGQMIGLEKYKFVRLVWFMNLFSMVLERT